MSFVPYSTGGRGDHPTVIVDVSSVTTPVRLSRGQTAVLKFRDKTNVNVPLKLDPDDLYRLYLFTKKAFSSPVSASETILKPNGQTYTGQFRRRAVVGTGSSVSSIADTTDTFVLGRTERIACVFWVSPATTNKFILGTAASKSSSGVYETIDMTHVWWDETTAWTSFGEIVFPATISGKLVVERLL